ncbi:MAG: 1,4-dihydroxy-2-naphthoate polyprenyltransferase [Ignavibacteriaceae bacterium]
MKYLNNWLIASRPKTLLAAVVPVMVGSALAVYENNFTFIYSFVALLCSLLIQIGTNFSNDLYDYLKGADTAQRKGPQRVLASGIISIREMKAAVFITFAAAFLLGLYLVLAGGPVILVIGILSIIAGLAYTAGPYPLAYNGLGDIFVFIFFGLIGTMGTYYLHSHEFTLLSFLISIPVGALITNILVVNNFRDIEEDKAARKYTLAVKLGRTFTRYQFIFSIILSFLVPLLLFSFYNLGIWIFLPYLTIPLAIKMINMLFTFDGKQLNKTLELAAKFSAIFGLLFSFGMIL